MKILCVSPGVLYSPKYPFERAGSESQIYGISRELVKMGHDVYITGRFDSSHKNKYETNEVKFLSIKTPCLHDNFLHQIPSSIIYSKLVSRITNKINPDILVLNERFSSYFPSKLKKHKVFITHNPDAMDFYKEFSFRNNKINYFFFRVKRKIEESVLANSDVVISLNETIDDYLHSKGFANTVMIPNSVDIHNYRNAGDHNYILFAGRLNKVKGVQYLIDSFSKMDPSFNTYLYIVGSGPEDSYLKEFAISKNISHRIKFIPTVGKEKLSEYFSKCTIFVLPSIFETFGIVLLEAMASSKPVIASCIPGPMDVITHGYNGFLFEKENVDELKKYLDLCFSDKKLCEKLGSNAKKTVEENYTFSKNALLHCELYDQIINNIYLSP